MLGSLELSFEREPNFFNSSRIEGDNHVTLIARNNNDKVIGIGSRSSRPYWHFGDLNLVGYFSQLRVNRGFRGVPSHLLKAWDKMYEVHQEIKDSQFYLVSILEDNIRARKVLTSGVKNIPTHLEWGRLNTYILPLVKRKVKLNGYLVRRGTTQDRTLIVEWINKNYREMDFAPYWNEEMIFNSDLQLSPEDFFLISRDESPQEVLGCLAVWDQSEFKQVLVHGYESKIRRVRPWLNLLRRWTGFPYFPKVGEAFSHAYLSHLAIDKSHIDALPLLIQTAVNENLDKGFHYLTLGLLDGSDWAKQVDKKFKPYTLKSIMYFAYWDNAENLNISKISPLNSHVEIAIL